VGGQTLCEKIATLHRRRGPERPLRAGDVVSLRPRHLLTHDNTAAVIDRFGLTGARTVRYPWQSLITLDHDVQNTDPEQFAVWRRIEEFARRQRLEFRPCGSGVGHQIMVEEGFAVPGALCVAADSHANIYGALGALGTPVVRSDAMAIWATGEFWWEVPRSVRVRLEGRLPGGVTGKDLILALCARYRDGEVHGAVVEFDGSGVETLPMDDRFTVANMTTEWGAIGGIFPVDATTIEYLEWVRRELVKRGQRRFTKAQLGVWATAPLAADRDAAYAATITVDLATVSPTLTGPASPATVAPEQTTVSVDKAFLVGCANARTGDLAAAARVVRGRKVHSRVKFYVAAASRRVQDEAVRSGVWQTLLDAGARTLPPGCAMCIGLGEGILEAGEVAVSATNRNYPGRMGHVDAHAWLASPGVVAEAAITGEIRPGPSRMEATFEAGEAIPAIEADTRLVAGFPHRIEGAAVFVPADDLDTDQIYPSTAVYRELGTEDMAALVFRNHDPGFGRVAAGARILVGGLRFGCGSSREQAATALAHVGFELVITGSTARSFRRNAANHGLLCVESPDFVQHLQRGRESARTVALVDPVVVDFTTATLHYQNRDFVLVRPPALIQEFHVDGGVLGRMRRRFGNQGGRR
jgi:homoaconitate hydratase